MPVKLSTTVNNINTIPNKENQMLVKEFYEFMKTSGTSDKYQNNNQLIYVYHMFSIVC
jgi:hypothetical protein